MVGSWRRVARRGRIDVIKLYVLQRCRAISVGHEVDRVKN